MGQTTITGTVATAAAASSTPSTGLPPKPEMFFIMPGRGLLSTSPFIQSDQKRTAGEVGRGPTEYERVDAENTGWIEVIRALAGHYVISTWGDETPWGLKMIWELIASSLFRQMELITSENTEDRALAQPLMWLKQARMELDRLKLPEGDANRSYLLKEDGTPLRFSASRQPRPKIFVGSPNVTFFPGNWDETSESGGRIGGSLMEFQKRHGKRLYSLWNPSGL